MRKSFIALIASLFIATSASAQLASDEIPHQRTLPVNEQVRRDLETSRFRFGIFRVRPSVAMRDFGYDNNVFGTPTDRVSDWRSTVSAGVTFIVPLGSKLYARGNFNPEYTWYRKLTDRRVLGGKYGGSVLGLFNRLTVEAGAATYKGLSLLSSELERETLGRQTTAYGNAEVEIFRRLSVFGGARQERQRYDLSAESVVGAASLSGLERNDEAARGGIRYRFASFLALSLAAEKMRSDFLTAKDHNNDSHAVLFGIRYDRPRSFINLSVGSRAGEARIPGTADFPRYRTTTGSYYASHELGRHAVIDLYGHRGLVYALYADNAYFIETRNGAGLMIPMGRRIALRAFGEVGSNNYPRAVQSVKRIDDALAWGGGLRVGLYRNIGLTVIASKVQYNSNLPDFDRSVLRIATSISLQRDLFR